jgi:hypothetical protein
VATPCELPLASGLLDRPAFIGESEDRGDASVRAEMEALRKLSFAIDLEMRVSPFQCSVDPLRVSVQRPNRSERIEIVDLNLRQIEIVAQRDRAIVDAIP